MSKLTPEQQADVAKACSMFGIRFGDDVEKLSPAQKEALAAKLKEIKDRAQA